MSAVNEGDRDGGREGRFSDPAFAHRHDHAVTGGVELVDQLIKARKVDGRSVGPVGGRCDVGAGQLPQRREPGHVSGDQVDRGGGQRRELRGRAVESGALAVGERERRRVLPWVADEAVEHEPLVGDAERAQFCACAGRFTQRAVLGAGDEDQCRERGVGECRDGCRVLLAALVKARERAEAAGAGGVLVDVSAPRARERQQPQGVAGRRGVEDDVVKLGGVLRRGQNRGELVERGDLDGARA